MLELDGVTKRYGDRAVVDGASFTVAPGRMTGFVGANGAGKTTTMRIILGVLAADSGRVLLDGVELGQRGRRRFGYMPEERGLYPKMRLADQLVYLARLHGLDTARAARNTAELLERLGLAARQGDPVEKLSLGNQQRAQIAAALVHEPTVLVLDEPFSGLDPIAVETVMAVLRERADAGAPVLFSSHQLDIVERLCDDLVIIADGRIRANGPTEALREAHAGLRYRIQTAAPVDWLREQAGVRVLELDGDAAVFDADGADAARAALTAALTRGEVTDFARQRPRLAEIFAEVVR